MHDLGASPLCCSLAVTALLSMPSASAGAEWTPIPVATDCPATRLEGAGKLDSSGRTTPVIFVHGIISSPDMWGDGALKGPSPGTGVEKTLIRQAAEIPGLSFYTFDYADYSLRWVDDQMLGPRFAKALGCIRQATGRKAIVIGHSMGGLVTKYAMGQPDGHGHHANQDVREVITLGTPYEGSALLSGVNDVADDADAMTKVPWFGASLAFCGFAAQLSPRGGGICKLAGVPRTPAGRALTLHSQKLKELLDWPAGLPVHALGGDIDYTWHIGGAYLGTFDIGDLPVDKHSSRAGGTFIETDFRPHCASTNGMKALLHFPCFHSNLQVAPRVVDRVLTILRAAVSDSVKEVTDAVARAGTAASTSMLVIDTSGSMSDPAGSTTKIEAAQQASLSALQIIEAEQQAGRSEAIGVVGFNSEPTILAELGSDLDEARLAASDLVASDGTNIGDALTAALDALRTAPGDKSIILLSDGLTEEGPSNEEILSDIVPRAAAESVRICTVAIGDDADGDLLRSIAKATDCAYSETTSLTELRNAFVLRRQQSNGIIAATNKGTVAEGQVSEASTISIPPGQSLLEVSLTWPTLADSPLPAESPTPVDGGPTPEAATSSPPVPSPTATSETGVEPGNILGLELTDPAGDTVDNSYSAGTFLPGNPTVVIVRQPRPGKWHVHVRGISLPAGGQAFFSVASRQKGNVAQAATPLWRKSVAPSLIVLGVLSCIAVLDAVVLRRRRVPAVAP